MKNDKNDLKLVQLNMRSKTLEEVEELKNLLSTSNRSDVIRTSIDVTTYLASEMSAGASIIVVGKDGHKKQIVIPGVSKNGNSGTGRIL